MTTKPRELRDLIHTREGEQSTDLTEELDAAVTAVQQTVTPPAPARTTIVRSDQGIKEPSS